MSLTFPLILLTTIAAAGVLWLFVRLQRTAADLLAATRCWGRIEQSIDRLLRHLEESASRQEKFDRGTETTNQPAETGRTVERGLLKDMAERLWRLERHAGPRASKMTPTWNEAGELTRVKITEGEEPVFSSITSHKPESVVDQLLSRRAFELRQGRRGPILNLIKAPYFQYYNYFKKLDILSDEAFRTIAARAIESGNTHLLHDRLYVLWQIVRNVAELRSPIVEVGVWRGGSTGFLAEAQRHFGKAGKIYACDTFAGHASIASEIDGEHRLGGFGESVKFEDVQKYLEPYPEIETLRGDIERTAAGIVEDAISIIHLDVDVYLPTKFALDTLGQRLEKSGVLIIDDYGFTTCPGAKRATDEFVGANPSFKLLHLFTGQALLFRS